MATNNNSPKGLPKGKKTRKTNVMKDKESRFPNYLSSQLTEQDRQTRKDARILRRKEARFPDYL